MLKRILGLSCKIGWHEGKWVYSEPEASENCTQTKFCWRCGVHMTRVWHDMEWKSDGFFSSAESGVCVRCERRETRDKPKGSGA